LQQKAGFDPDTDIGNRTASGCEFESVANTGIPGMGVRDQSDYPDYELPTQGTTTWI